MRKRVGQVRERVGQGEDIEGGDSEQRQTRGGQADRRDGRGSEHGGQGKDLYILQSTARTVLPGTPKNSIARNLVPVLYRAKIATATGYLNIIPNNC